MISTIVKSVTVWLLVVGVCAWQPSLMAHRGSAVWTEIVWRDHHFQITHRLHAADALLANRAMGGSGELDTPEELARLALYVERRFSLSGTAVNQSGLVTLGAELEGDFAFVYQEWFPAEPPRTFPTIVNTLLIDLVGDSQRFVRIETPRDVEERRF